MYRVHLLALLVAGTALVASGCGDDDPAARTNKPRHAATAGVITPPVADTKLKDQLGPVAAQLTAGGCSFGTYKEDEAAHVKDGSSLTWSTFPPTSGVHYDDWAPFGRYEDPVEDGYVVHDLEHGGVAVWIGPKVTEPVSAAIDKLLDDGEKWIVMPRSDLPGIFSAAWGKGLTCPPQALAKLGPAGTARALDAWYEAVASTGSNVEKDLPAYAGAMKDPTPKRDISTPSPFSA